MTSPVLYPEQKPHFDALGRSLENYRFAIDASPPGTGKTHILSAISKKYDRSILVIGPNSARLTWAQAIKGYDLKIIEDGFINYESFRPTGKSGKPKHGFFLRNESDHYVSTEKLHKLAKSKALIVFDEAQALKSKTTSNFKSAKIMISELLKGNCWVMLLSGSLIDKPNQTANYLYLLGIMSKTSLYENHFNNITLDGIYDLDSWARKTENYEKYMQMRERFIPKPNESRKFIYNVFMEIVKPEIISIMPKVMPKDDKGEDIGILDVKNGFYRLDKRERILYEEAISYTQKNIFLQGTSNIDVRKLTKLLVYIQRYKINALIRIIKEDLKKENNKVIVFVNYNEVCDELLIALKEYNPIYLGGKVNVETRNYFVEKFQQGDGEYRLIVANTMVGAKSLNLHDTTGLFPRRMYIMPSYFINDLHQATFRTFRVGTIGVAYVRYFYGLTETGETEAKLLDSIIRSGKVMFDTMKEQNVPFPCDYESYYEEEIKDEDEDDLLKKLRELATD